MQLNKFLTFILLLTFLSIYLLYCVKQTTFPFSIDLLTTNNQTINSTSFTTNGQFVFIEFWYYGCSPCIKMFDAVRDNYDEWNEKTDFKIIAIASQEADKQTISLIENRNWPYEFYFDPHYNLFRELSKFHNPNDMKYSFPTIFVFGPDWVLIDKLSGVKQKWINDYTSKQGDSINQDMLVIDLQYYYNLYNEYNSNK